MKLEMWVFPSPNRGNDFFFLCLCPQFIRTDLADELGLKDLAYAKEFADWTDVKIMIHYIIALDLHEYKQNRFRVQLVFLYLLFSASGERPGAVVRSEAYRNTNDALRYKVKLSDSHGFSRN